MKKQDNTDLPVVIVQKLKKSYRTSTVTEALRGIDIKVNRGEIFGIIGENGAGKTTAVECMLGSNIPDSGTVNILGFNPFTSDRKTRKALFNRIGFQFQQTNFRNKIKVYETCETTAALYDNPADWKELLKIFKLDSKEHEYISALSGGQKQKLSVLLALIPSPELVFLDELTTGLDPKARRSMWIYLKQLQSEGITIILSSHYMDEVEYLCSRIAILKDGLITAEGTPAELISRHSTKNLEETFLLYMKKDDDKDFIEN